LDATAAAAAALCNTASAFISLVDADTRHIKGSFNYKTEHTTRSGCLCEHAILNATPTIIADITTDPRTCDSPLATGSSPIHFYAAAPIRSAKGITFGTLCVVHPTPHSLAEHQINALNALAFQLAHLFEVRTKLKTVLTDKTVADGNAAKWACTVAVTELANDTLAAAKERAEHALRHAARFREAIDQHSLVCLADEAGTILEVNDAFCTRSGYTRQELLGQDHSLLYPPECPLSFWTQLWSTIATGAIWSGEVCYRSKSGDLFWVDTTVVPFKGGEGEGDRHFELMNDVTARKNAATQTRIPQNLSAAAA
jgi:PAS domain S-box-containing protein